MVGWGLTTWIWLPRYPLLDCFSKPRGYRSRSYKLLSQTLVKSCRVKRYSWRCVYKRERESEKERERCRGWKYILPGALRAVVSSLSRPSPRHPLYHHHHHHHHPSQVRYWALNRGLRCEMDFSGVFTIKMSCHVRWGRGARERSIWMLRGMVIWGGVERCLGR